MSKTIGAAAHVAGYAGAQDPARLHVAPVQREPLEVWRQRMEDKRTAARGRTQKWSSSDVDPVYSPEDEPLPARELTAEQQQRVDRDEAIAAAYVSAGQPSTAELGRRYGLTSTGVAKILRRQGVQLRPKGPSRRRPVDDVMVVAAPAEIPVVAPRPVPRPPVSRTVTADERDRLAAITAYTAGDGIREICSRLHRAEKVVRGWLVGAGVQIRPKGSHPRPSRDEAIAAAYVDEGLATPQLALRFGLSVSRVNQILHAQGVELRPPTQAQAPARTVEPPPAPVEPDPPAPAPAYVDEAMWSAAVVDDPAPAPVPVLLPENVLHAIHHVVSALMDAAAGLAGAAHGMAQLEAYAALLLPAPPPTQGDPQ